jgi:hypothetical protein
MNTHKDSVAHELSFQMPLHCSNLQTQADKKIHTDPISDISLFQEIKSVREHYSDRIQLSLITTVMFNNS